MANFGEKCTIYNLYSEGTYGSIIKLTTVPNIRKVTGIQAKTDSLLSDMINEETAINDLMNYPNEADAPDIAYAYESGTIYIYLNLIKYPYEDATRILLMGYRYPYELTSLDSVLDILPEDLELFTALCQDISADLQGHKTPQKVLNKIEYFKRLISLE